MDKKQEQEKDPIDLASAALKKAVESGLVSLPNPDVAGLESHGSVGGAEFDGPEQEEDYYQQSKELNND